MVRRKRVLIFPAGSEIGLEIFDSLKYSHHVEVFGASGKSDHAGYIYDAAHYIEAPLYIDRDDFIPRFEALLTRHGIEFVYPTHDDIAWFLAAHQSQLSAKILTSAAETNRIARFKDLTYETFASAGFCPEVFVGPGEPPFPLFLKPVDGQGGKGTHLAQNAEDLAFYRGRNPGLLAVEYLPGEELSVDCFTDFSGRLLFVGPRTRERVQMGISFRSTAVPLSDEISAIAHAINDAVSLDGAWFFQVKKSASGRFKLLEFAPRQSSTMGLYRHAGVNFALLTLFNAQRIPVEIRPNAYALQLDRRLHNRYRADLDYDRVYIDFDETIATGTAVHEQAMAFIYQCRNRGKAVVLITKHRLDLADTLKRLGISEHLFEAILHLRDDEDKWRAIDPAGAIFIDNYWHDRKAVSDKLGIPVFDADAIECLLI
jgi:hypothetical protein